MAPSHKNGDKGHPEQPASSTGLTVRNDIMVAVSNTLDAVSRVYHSSNITSKRLPTGVQRLLWHYWRSRPHSCCYWCLFSHHAHTALCWKAGSNVNSPTLTVWVDNATCSEGKFLRSLCWGIGVFSNTTIPWNPIDLLKKEQRGLPKSQRWGKPFPRSSHLWAPILLLRKHNRTQNTSLESLEAAAVQRVWQKLLFPVPPECPAQILPSCDRFFLALHLHLLLPAAGNRKNRNGHSAAELCTTGSGFWHRGKVTPQDLKALFGAWCICGSIGRSQQRKKKKKGKKEQMLWAVKASIPHHCSTLEASGLLFLEMNFDFPTRLLKESEAPCEKKTNCSSWAGMALFGRNITGMM